MMKEEIKKVRDILKNVSRLVVLTGAGISAESGVPTFRGKEGLWKNFRPEQVANPEAFFRNPSFVWEWYDYRRQILEKVKPNPGHLAIAYLEKMIKNFVLITQNVDGLHQQAGSQNCLELHGNIWRMRCVQEEEKIWQDFSVPLKKIPPLCSCGELARPDIVWFGESLPEEVLHKSYSYLENCEVILVVGTSGMVYPAAGFPSFAKEKGAKVIEVNLEPTPLSSQADYCLFGKSGEILSAVLG